MTVILGTTDLDREKALDMQVLAWWNLHSSWVRQAILVCISPKQTMKQGYECKLLFLNIISKKYSERKGRKENK